MYNLGPGTILVMPPKLSFKNLEGKMVHKGVTSNGVATVPPGENHIFLMADWLAAALLALEAHEKSALRHHKQVAIEVDVVTGLGIRKLKGLVDYGLSRFERDSNEPSFIVFAEHFDEDLS